MRPYRMTDFNRTHWRQYFKNWAEMKIASNYFWNYYKDSTISPIMVKTLNSKDLVKYYKYLNHKINFT